MIEILILKTLQLFTDNPETHILMFVFAALVLLSWEWRDVNPNRKQKDRLI